MKDTKMHDQAQAHAVRYFEGRAVAYRPDYYYLGGHGYQLDIVYWIPERPDRKKRMSAEVFYALTTPEPTLTRREAAGLARLVDTEMPGLTRSERLGWASRVLGRPIQTFKGLTRSEARVLRRELLRDTIAEIGG